MLWGKNEIEFSKYGKKTEGAVLESQIPIENKNHKHR